MPGLLTPDTSSARLLHQGGSRLGQVEEGFQEPRQGSTSKMLPMCIPEVGSLGAGAVVVMSTCC